MAWQHPASLAVARQQFPRSHTLARQVCLHSSPLPCNLARVCVCVCVFDAQTSTAAVQYGLSQFGKFHRKEKKVRGEKLLCCLFVCLLLVCLFAWFVCLFFCLFFCLFAWFVCLFVCLFVRFACLFALAHFYCSSASALVTLFSFSLISLDCDEQKALYQGA